MDLDPSDPNFLVPTSIKQTTTPIAFDVYRNSSSFLMGSKNETMINYEHVLTNYGDAMSLDGVFVAPIDGVYTFTLSFVEYHRASFDVTDVELRVDDEVVGKLRSHYGSTEEDANVSQTIVVKGPEGFCSFDVWVPGRPCWAVRSLYRASFVPPLTGGAITAALPVSHEKRERRCSTARYWIPRAPAAATTALTSRVKIRGRLPVHPY